MTRSIPLALKLLFLFVVIAVAYIAVFSWVVRTRTLSPSSRETDLDLQAFDQMKVTYQDALDRALATKDVKACDALPDIFLPYRRDSKGRVLYVSTQVDGPTVPDRYRYWPRIQCVYGYAKANGEEACDRVFATDEERRACAVEVQQAPVDRYARLENYPQDRVEDIGTRTYVSTKTGKRLPYFVFYPEKVPQGILIYVHGAGGGLEQGVLDGTYKDSFKHLKHLLKTDRPYLYVTPSISDFGAGGGQDVNDLAMELRTRYPNLPIYLAGASAGGRTVFYAMRDPRAVFSGVIAMCPAIDQFLMDSAWKSIISVPLWIEQGDQDQLVPAEIVDSFVRTLERDGHHLIYQKVQGDHGAPIDQMDWDKALGSLLH